METKPQNTKTSSHTSLTSTTPPAMSGVLRAGEALAALLGVEAVEFPGDHGGFVANAWSPQNDPAAFAAKLREVLDGD